jgi:hypothetical protein
MLARRAPSSTDVTKAIGRLVPTLAQAAVGASIAGNRRREIRRSVRLGCRAVRGSNHHLVGDRTLDLSAEGLLLLSDEEFDPGEELVVSFRATELPIWFDTKATVARVIQNRRPGDRGRAVGVRFGSLPAVSRLILRGYLRNLPPTFPQRIVPKILETGGFVDYAEQIRRIWLYG